MNKKMDETISTVADYVMLANDQLSGYRNKSKLKNYLTKGEGTLAFKRGVVKEKLNIAIQALKRGMTEL